MRCPRCHTENPAQAKFCLECASPLARACPGCGTPLPPTAKFCPECAHPVAGREPGPSQPRFRSPQTYTPRHLVEKILTSRGALEGERKQVTVLFADLKGSMEPLADRDPEEARTLLDPVLERMMEAVHRYAMRRRTGRFRSAGARSRSPPASVACRSSYVRTPSSGYSIKRAASTGRASTS
jgi:hypothetical protein